MQTALSGLCPMNAVLRQLWGEVIVKIEQFSGLAFGLSIMEFTGAVFTIFLSLLAEKPEMMQAAESLAKGGFYCLLIGLLLLILGSSDHSIMP